MNLRLLQLQYEKRLEHDRLQKLAEEYYESHKNDHLNQYTGAFVSQPTSNPYSEIPLTEFPTIEISSYSNNQHIQRVNINSQYGVHHTEQYRIYNPPPETDVIRRARIHEREILEARLREEE